MKCMKCGAEVNENSKFCTSCGASVEEGAASGNQNFQSAPIKGGSSSGNSDDGLLTVIKFLGIGVGVLFALFSVLSVFGLIGGVVKIFTSYYHVYQFFCEAFGVIKLVANLAIALGFFATGFHFRKEKINSTFTLAAGGAVLLLIYSFVSIVLHAITFKGFSPVGIFGFVFALILTGVLFALLYASGNMPYAGCTMEEIKASLAAIPDVIKECFNEVAESLQKQNTQPGPAAQPQQFNQPQGAAQPQQFNQPQDAAQPQQFNQPQGGAYPQQTNQTAVAVHNPYVIPASVGVALKTNRSLIMWILLSCLTCGIYSYYFIYKLASDVNIACAGDGKKTPGMVMFVLLGVLTCGIYALYWYYCIGNRLAENAPRYGMIFSENGTTILLWFLLGSFACGLGPFVGMHILVKNTNAICQAYNRANNLA